MNERRCEVCLFQKQRSVQRTVSASVSRHGGDFVGDQPDGTGAILGNTERMMVLTAVKIPAENSGKTYQKHMYVY